jgi:hypothetical protein
MDNPLSAFPLVELYPAVQPEARAGEESSLCLCRDERDATREAILLADPEARIAPTVNPEDPECSLVEMKTRPCTRAMNGRQRERERERERERGRENKEHSEHSSERRAPGLRVRTSG